MSLRDVFTDGYGDALLRFKVAAPAPKTPASAPKVLGGKADPPPVTPTPVLSPQDVTTAAAQRDVMQVPGGVKAKTAEDICTSCRKPKHYGPCAKPTRTPPEGTPHKAADFNPGLRGGGDEQSNSPSMSPNYASSTVADSGPARARPGNPEDQVRSTHQDFFRPSFQNQAANEWGNAYGALVKTCANVKWGGIERRGPTVDPYTEQMLAMSPPTSASPPIARGYVGDQAIDHAFGQIDGAVDSTCIENGSGAPQGGPAALG